MKLSPELAPLSRQNRRFVFVSMLLLFIVLVPLLVFYAVGYRFDWADGASQFRIVGGLYINAGVSETRIFLNGEPVQNMRLFRNAAYIQNVPAGVHEVYVEGDGVITWVKELPVFAQLVTEAHSFNIPSVPQVRLVTAWLDPDTGASVVFASTSTSTVGVANASTTNLLLATSTMATSSFARNAEYSYVESLFASSSRALNEMQRVRTQDLESRFLSDRTPVSSGTSSAYATTTKQVQNMRLYEQGGEVYATWEGESKSIPYYFCVNFKGAEETELLYGSHVYRQLSEQVIYSIANNAVSGVTGQTLCRHTIRIDRAFQDVLWFDFLPGTSDLVLLHLTEGLYVTEIDDRSWQNIQLLYPGNDLSVMIDGRKIYVQDGDVFLEVFLEIAS